MLVYTGVHLCPNNFADLIVDTQRYQNGSLNPGSVCDDGDFNRWEKVLTEVTALGVIPSKPFVLERHKMVKEVMFDGSEEAQRMKVISFVSPLLSVTTVGCERGKDWGNGWDVGEWVSNDVLLNVKF